MWVSQGHLNDTLGLIPAKYTQSIYQKKEKIIIVGNLGGDPEMRYTPSGKAVTNFSVASNRRYTGSDGQRVDETTWFRISAWGRQAETCNQYLRRGSRVLIEGQLNPDKATGGPRVWVRQDGTPAASFEVTAQSVQFISTLAEDNQAAQPSQPSPAPAGDPVSDVEEDEIPF